MLTRWGKDVTADTAWTEYPRPQLVRSGWQNLNGIWQYAITERALAGFPAQWEGDIVVPFCVESTLSGVAGTLLPDQRLWYRRKFNAGNDDRTLLHFGAVDFEAVIWINGAYADSHRGGFDPFTIDITEFLQRGDNEIIVAVSDPTNRGDQPRGKQNLNPEGIWYTPVSGIWQTVWLEQVPRDNHIEELRITPARDCQSIQVIVFLSRPSRDPRLAVQIEVNLKGKRIIAVMARPDRKIVVPITDAQLWSPDSPTLYDLNISLVKVNNPLPQDNDEQRPASLWRQTPLRGDIEAGLYKQAVAVEPTLDHVSSYFGMRSIDVGPHPKTGEPTLLCNAQPLFQLGVLDQGWWPDGLQTPPSDEAIVYEIKFLKAAGFNTLRKHIKIEPSRYYYHCDRLGMLVWQDMPSGFLPAQFVAPNDEREGLRHGRATAQFVTDMHRMLHCLHNHPCIVMWVLHNEGWGQFDTRRLTEQIKATDPSRVVNSVSGWLDTGSGDVIDRHDYQSEPQAPEADGKRAIVVGEYGGLGWPVIDHLWNRDMRNWGYHTFHSQAALREAYAKTTAAIIAMYQQHGVCAAIYTQTTDVEGEVNGLLTYDRAVDKLDSTWLAQVHSPLRSLSNE